MKVLVTGSTGFLGQYVVAELLSRGHSVWALYRDELKRRRSLNFLFSALHQIEKERLSWLKADILEIGDCWEEYCRMQPGLEEVDTLLHSAASLRFKTDVTGEPARTNVGGARSLRQLAKRHPMKIHLISTAFVCGRIQGKTVYEVNHPPGDFINDYERSKWEAEQVWHGEATILRPGVIVGDSRTGHCTGFTGWYTVVKGLFLLNQVLKILPDTVRMNLRIDVPSNPESTINIIPVDYVAQAVVRIMENPNLHNRIFHLTHPAPPTHGWSHEVICRRFNIRGIQFIGLDAPIPQPSNELEQMIFKQVKAMLFYFSNNPIFDRSFTDRALPELEVPEINEAMINRLIDYAVETHWGESNLN
ncbi:MAG: SDR family oxidoreductase [Thermodesulfobacteriota bacterium]